jgi:hypothetical protein
VVSGHAYGCSCLLHRVGSYHGSYYTMDSIEPSCTSLLDTATSLIEYRRDMGWFVQVSLSLRITVFTNKRKE